MNRHLELQKEFQQLGNQTVGDINYIPSVEERKLRLKLALEELSELAEAFGLTNYFTTLIYLEKRRIEEKFPHPDSEIYNQKEVLDALIDIEVINNGTIITCGFQDIFDENYEIVDTNNKTKFHTSFDEATKTVDKLTETGNENLTISEIVVNNKKYFTVKNSDGKILKPYNYEKVNLKLK